MIVFDAFCSNGSTWIDKEWFNSFTVVKNDIRNGEFLIGGRQKIIIEPNTSINMFEFVEEIDIKYIKSCSFTNEFDLIYLDPPHSLKTTGIMNEKYTHLPNDWMKTISNMFANTDRLANQKTTIILKWNENEIPIKEILNIAKSNNIYPLFGSKVRTKTYWIVFKQGIF